MIVLKMNSYKIKYFKQKSKSLFTIYSISLNYNFDYYNNRDYI